MRKLFPSESPAEFVFIDPDTEHEYRADSRATLIKHILGYRSQNQLKPIEHLHAVLENFWCRFPQNAYKCEDVELERGFVEEVHGAVNLVKNIFFGEKNMVDQAEADRRSAICTTCPENVFPDKTTFIAWSDKIADASTFGKRSEHHDALGNCAVCSCPLRSKVWAKNVSVKEADKPKFPSFCWQLDDVRKD